MQIAGCYKGFKLGLFRRLDFQDLGSRSIGFLFGCSGQVSEGFVVGEILLFHFVVAEKAGGNLLMLQIIKVCVVK